MCEQKLRLNFNVKYKGTELVRYLTLLDLLTY